MATLARYEIFMFNSAVLTKVIGVLYSVAITLANSSFSGRQSN